ncbi:MAG: hypothetical protein PVH88_11965 [Ignavibacteria bacterium]|jgi:hypothetical protein
MKSKRKKELFIFSELVEILKEHELDKLLLLIRTNQLAELRKEIIFYLVKYRKSLAHLL